MPPMTAKALERDPEKVIRDWVQGGAVYTEHWAFIAPETIGSTQGETGELGAERSDRFAGATGSAGMLATADRYRLIRRVSLDLGLLPTPQRCRRLHRLVPVRMKGWWIGCWLARISASAGRSRGWTCVPRIPTAERIARAPSGRGVIG